MSIDRQNTLKVSELKNVVRTLAVNNLLNSTAIYISGPPGIGKTALFEQMAKEIDADYEVFLTATMDPTDVCGVPMAKGDMTAFLPPERLMKLTTKFPSDKITIAAFEDLPACPEQVFAALFRLFHEREVGGYPIRDNVLMCATGNRSGDRAGAQELPTALANRFVHFEQKVDYEEWVNWAMLSGIDPMVVAFINRNGGTQYLHNFDPDQGDPSFASPRTVAKASTLYKVFQGQDRELLASLSGCCGDNWANAFLNWAKIKDKMIPIDEILKHPKTAKLPAETEIDLAFVTIAQVVCAIVENMTNENISAALTYSERIPARDMGMKLAFSVLSVLKENGNNFPKFFQSELGVDTLKSLQKTFGKFSYLE